uniref:Uncharacterized protein n=1 Tax=Hyaloperonospora arabidopsidis (strain Emoy2) TaxID=559515 RepID=M4B4A3_HYAAE
MEEVSRTARQKSAQDNGGHHHHLCSGSPSATPPPDFSLPPSPGILDDLTMDDNAGYSPEGNWYCSTSRMLPYSSFGNRSKNVSLSFTREMGLRGFSQWTLQ